MKINTKDWRFFVPLILGILILVNSLIWIILNGGRWFEFTTDPNGVLPNPKNGAHKVFGAAYMLAYFTVQTNLFLGVMFIVIALRPTAQSYSWFMGSNMLISITFALYWTLLAPFNNPIEEWTSPYFVISTSFMHAINPIMGFVFLALLRHEILVNKRVLGLCALYMPIYFVFSAIVFGAGATVVDGKLDGAVIYGFLNLQKVFFIDTSAMPALGVFINLFVFLISAFLPIGISWIWIKVCKIETEEQSYFRWMDRCKTKLVNRKNR